MASKGVQCVMSFSRASLSHATTLRRGLTVPLHRRFISLSGKDGGTAIKVDVENQRIDASNFMKIGVKLAEVSVGNGLMVDVALSPSAGVSKQTRIMDQGSQTTYLNIQATTHTGPCALDAILPIYAGLYGNPHSHTHPYCWETKKVIDIAREYVARLSGAYPKGILCIRGATGSNDVSIKYVAMLYKSEKHIIALQTEQKCVLDLRRHLQGKGSGITYLAVENNDLIDLEHLEKAIRPDTALVSIIMVNDEIGIIQQMEIRKFGQKQTVFSHKNTAQAQGKISADAGKWNVDWMGVPGHRVYGPKCIGACYIPCGLKGRIDPPISDGGQEDCLPSRNLAHLLMIGFREVRRIAQGGIGYTRTSEPFFSLNPIRASTVQDHYIHQPRHNKQPKKFTRALSTKSHRKAVTENGKGNATTKDSKVGIRKAILTDATKGRNRKWTTLYSNMTIPEAEERLKLSLNLRGIPVKQMLEGKSVLLGPDLILRVKKRIYEGLVDYLKVAGYPTEADPDFKEANINDIVVLTIYPLLSLFQDETPRNLHLSREKEIASKDSSTSGMEEFVVMDSISYNQRDYVLIAEAKKVSLGQARKQCFLAMKDMWDFNGGGTVYGFITMGDSWRMVSFDGKFKMSIKMDLLFDCMDKDEKGWMANYSILIDCLNVALSNGGKDPVEAV